MRKARGEHSDTLDKSNRLFTTGFIDSMMKPVPESPEKPSTLEVRPHQQPVFAQEKYLESARRLDKPPGSTNTVFQPDNIQDLVQKFLYKDTETSINLNTSLG